MEPSNTAPQHPQHPPPQPETAKRPQIQAPAQPATQPATQAPNQAPPAAAAHPHIRSFSGRRGHITSGQRLAYDTLLPRYSIDYRPQTLDLAQVFGRTGPTILEIGFGMGESTAAIAQRMPHCDFLGVEVYPAGIGSLLGKIESLSLSNVRIIGHDAYEVVRDMIAPASLAGVHVFFPDPWPKARHHKRRLIRPDFVAMLAQRLADDGYLHCATDWEDYAQQMLQVLSDEPALRNSVQRAGNLAVTDAADAAATAAEAGFAPRPDYRPLTRFEQRGLRLGHQVRDVVFRRRPR